MTEKNNDNDGVVVGGGGGGGGTRRQRDLPRGGEGRGSGRGRGRGRRGGRRGGGDGHYYDLPHVRRAAARPVRRIRHSVVVLVDAPHWAMVGGRGSGGWVDNDV